MEVVRQKCLQALILVTTIIYCKNEQEKERGREGARERVCERVRGHGACARTSGSDSSSEHDLKPPAIRWARQPHSIGVKDEEESVDEHILLQCGEPELPSFR